MIKNICFNCGELTKNSYPLCLKCEPSPISLNGSCIFCGIETSKFVKVCPNCLDMNWAFKSNYSIFPYSGLSKEILNQFKFKKDSRYAVYYAEKIYNYILDNFHEKPLICPIPTSNIKRKIKNGYQLDSIVTELKKLDLKVSPLLKKRYSKTQKKLNKIERMNNLNNSFYIKKSKNKIDTIILLDDVFTTGATINSCAKVLKEKYNIIHSITLCRD